MKQVTVEDIEVLIMLHIGEGHKYTKEAAEAIYELIYLSDPVVSKSENKWLDFEAWKAERKFRGYE